MKETIGNATYLRKGSGDYIPFRLEMIGTNCTIIDQMLKE